MSAPPPSNPSGVSKAKSRTSASIPAMRASGVLREPSVNPLLAAGSATPVSASVRSDKLEEEARKMEDRLSHLKAAMITEKQKRDTLPKTKAGTYWKSANPTQNDKKYMEEVLARVEKRIAKSNAVGAGAGAAGAVGSLTAAASGSQSTRAPAGSMGSAAAVSKPAVQRTASANVSKSGGSSGGSGNAAAADTSVKSSYAPPIQPKNPISAPSAVRAQAGTSEQLAATIKAIPVVVGAPGQQQPSARSAASPSVSSRRPAAAASASASASASAADAEFSNPADDESRPSAPGSLLDGDFDEAANKAAFEEARQQWIAESSGSAGTAGQAAKPRVQLVHDPDFSPAQLASSGSGSGSAKQDSLLNGPAFNERESAREFQEARKAWMQSLDSSASAGAAPKAALKAQQQQQSDSSAHDADAMWNPTIALGTGGSILFPSSSDASRPQTATRVSSALRSAQSSLDKSSKSSCYGCYKLFYLSAAVTDADFTGKSFCSQACLKSFAASTKLRCGGDNCTRSALQAEGTHYGSNEQRRFMCKSCAGNGGKAVVAAAAAVPLSAAAPPSASSSSSSDPADPEPEPEAAAEADEEAEAEEDEEEEEDADGGVPEATSPEQNAFNAKARRSAGTAAAAAGVVAPPAAPESSPALPAAALSRPTTASVRPVLDTSVILQAPAGSAAPVVDFPSDDDE